VPPFILEVQCIGSDVANFACPFCNSTDRERHLFMFFDQLELWNKCQNARVLHFAPEPHLSARIDVQHPKTYIKADLYPALPEIQCVDVTNTHFDDDSFDVIICNHVLEHVPDDMKALLELYRILKPGGFVIIQTPYSNLLQNTFCDPAINTDKLRCRLYGQEDHVRLYGRELFLLIRRAGFQLQIKTHNAVLPGIDASIYGVNSLEDLILVAKESSSAR